MELSYAQYERMAPRLPVQRATGAVRTGALLYVAEHGCKWRGARARFGRWHTSYTRRNRRPKNGGLDRVFEYPRKERRVRIKPAAVSLARVQVHPEGLGALKNRASGKSGGGWTTTMPLGGAAARTRGRWRCRLDRRTLHPEAASCSGAWEGSGRSGRC